MGRYVNSKKKGPFVWDYPLPSLWKQSDPARVQVIGVSIDEEQGDIQRALPNLGVTFPMLIDSAGVLSGIYKVGGKVPATFVIDREGQLQFFSGGEDGSTDRVAQAVQALTGERNRLPRSGVPR